MERYYDGDQEALFKAAHVINPYVKPKRESKVGNRKAHLPIYTFTEPTTFTPHHLDTRHSFASDERVCVEILFFLLFLRSLLSRSLPGKTRSISEKVLICLLSSSLRPFVSR